MRFHSAEIFVSGPRGGLLPNSRDAPVMHEGPTRQV